MSRATLSLQCEIQQLSASRPPQIPVDAYGLPVRFKEELATFDEELEKCWDAALPEFPVSKAGTQVHQLPWLWIMSQRSAMLAHGRPDRGHGTERYVQSWKDVGFGPELYCLSHSMVWDAVEQRPRGRSGQAGRQWFAARLHELHLGTGTLGLQCDNLPAENRAHLPILVSQLTIPQTLERIIRRVRQVWTGALGALPDPGFRRKPSARGTV